MIYLIAVGLFLGNITTETVADIKKVLPSGIAYENIPGEIEEFVEEHKDTMGAMEIAIFDKEDVIYQNYFGFTNKAEKIFADENSVFEWGSVTKTLVWISVMQLWEEGILDLGEDIRSYLPEGFLTNLNYDTPITMINLMNHNAGFQDMLTDIFIANPDRVLSLEEQLKLHEPEQVYEPGTVTAYSNWSSGLGAYIVERLSGQSFAEYARENIFQKLGMEHTAIKPDLSDNEWVKEKREKLQCYQSDGAFMGKSFYSISLYPAGMCTGTLDDFRTFAQALVPEDGNDCVLFQNPNTLDELRKATSYYGDTDIPLNHHGFWTMEYGVSVLGHGGNTAGGSSNLLLNLESGIGMVIMTNQKYEQIFNYDMAELVFGSYNDSKLFEDTKEPVEGVFRDARTILKGPLSIYSVSFGRLGESDLNKFWVYSNQNGVEKVITSYGDILKLSTAEYVLTTALIMLVVAGVLYVACTLIIGGCIITPIYKRKGVNQGVSDERNSFIIWNYVACGTVLLWTINLAGIVYQCITYAPSSYYIWQFILCALLGIFMVAIEGWFIYHCKNIPGTWKNRIKYALTAFSLLIIIIATLYWQLYQFWAV